MGERACLEAVAALLGLGLDLRINRALMCVGSSHTFLPSPHLREIVLQGGKVQLYLVHLLLLLLRF